MPDNIEIHEGYLIARKLLTSKYYFIIVFKLSKIDGIGAQSQLLQLISSENKKLIKCFFFLK